MTPARVLKIDQLYQSTDPKLLKFKTTEDLEDLTEVIGQPRAVESVQFGVGIRSEGYNLFALGPAGTGKRSLLRRSFEDQASEEPVPSDWIYVETEDRRE